MTQEQNAELEHMGRAFFARKDAVYDLLVANRNEQQKNIAIWSSLQSQSPEQIPGRYFPPCILDAARLIQSENLDDLRDALDEFVLGRPGAFERIKAEYQSKMNAMETPIKMLQDALADAELERATLMKLQRLIQDVEKLKAKWT
jgi:hypothetical protein